MEGVGARLGRSSTRYGPTTVFTGPVRKWKKRWVHVPPPSSAAANPPPLPSSAAVGSNNGNNGSSHLVLYKWTPLSDSNGNGNGGSKNGASVETVEAPKKRFRYVPVSVLEEQKNEAEKIEDEIKENEAEKIEDEIKENDAFAATDPSSEATKMEESGTQSDVNDVPMEDSQAPEKDQNASQEHSETSLDLNLELMAHDGDKGSN